MVLKQTLAQFVVEKLNKEGIFQNLFQMSSLDNGKIKTASIVRFALKYLVTASPAEEKQSLFTYWNGDKAAFNNKDEFSIQEYVAFCAGVLRAYFGAVKSNFRSEWDSETSKLLSVISINGFIIALTRQFPINGVNDFEYYKKVFEGWKMDFSNDGFQYTSSQYRKFSTKILKEAFKISEEKLSKI